MTRLNVCCALITLSSAHGPLLLAAKKACGQSNGLLYEFPGGKLEAGEDARDAIVREYGRNSAAPSARCVRWLPSCTGRKTGPYALSRFCANWRKAACPFPWSTKAWDSFPAVPSLPCPGRRRTSPF